MKQDEFDRYLKNLVQEAKRLNLIEGVFEKAGFQGVVIGLLSCEENAFTGRQVAKIIETVLDYEKAPGMRVPRGKGNKYYMMIIHHKERKINVLPGNPIGRRKNRQRGGCVKLRIGKMPIGNERRSGRIPICPHRMVLFRELDKEGRR